MSPSCHARIDTVLLHQARSIEVVRFSRSLSANQQDRVIGGAQLGSGAKMLGDSGGWRANRLHSQGLACHAAQQTCDRITVR